MIELAITVLGLSAGIQSLLIAHLRTENSRNRRRLELLENRVSILERRVSRWGA